MNENGKRFIAIQLVNAFLPKYRRKMNDLYSKNNIIIQGGSKELSANEAMMKAKSLIPELQRDLGPFFGLTQALAGLTRLFHVS